MLPLGCGVPGRGALLLPLDRGVRHVARKPNYGFEKRQKELERKNKKEEKLKRREEGHDDGSVSSEPGFDEYGRPITVIPGGNDVASNEATGA